MIRLQDLHKTYRRGGQDVHALRGVDLDVPAGQLLVLTGRSGAGKTTLLSLTAGPPSGRPGDDRGRRPAW